MNAVGQCQSGNLNFTIFQVWQVFPATELRILSPQPVFQHFGKLMVLPQIWNRGDALIPHGARNKATAVIAFNASDNFFLSRGCRFEVVDHFPSTRRLFTDCSELFAAWLIRTNGCAFTAGAEA